MDQLWCADNCSRRDGVQFPTYSTNFTGSEATRGSKACIRYHGGAYNRGNGQIVPFSETELDCTGTTPYIDLQAFDGNQEHIFAIKIDVEGAEVSVFEGMGADFNANLPCFIYIEIVDRRKKSPSGRTMTDFIEEKGYKEHHMGGVDYLLTLSAAENSRCPKNPLEDKRILNPPRTISELED